MKYKHIFWDWNGTLLNDAHVSFEAVNLMLDNRGLPRINFEQYREYVDVPIIKFYEKVMDVSKESMDALHVEFNSLCDKLFCDRPLFPEVCEVLNSLSQKGVSHYIFSSSAQKVILPKLKQCGIYDCFEYVLGASDCYAGSKVERTKNYIIDNDLPIESILFVGDMVHDSEVASAIGADCILIASGHQSESVLLSTGRTVLPSLSALAELL